MHEKLSRNIAKNVLSPYLVDGTTLSYYATFWPILKTSNVW